MGRRRIEAPIVITELEPNRKLAIRSEAGSILVRAAQTFEPAGSGTRVVEQLEMRLSGPLKLLEPVMRAQVGRQVRTVHQRMKQVMEGRHGADD